MEDKIRKIMKPVFKAISDFEKILCMPDDEDAIDKIYTKLVKALSKLSNLISNDKESNPESFSEFMKLSTEEKLNLSNDKEEIIASGILMIDEKDRVKIGSKTLSTIFCMNGIIKGGYRGAKSAQEYKIISKDNKITITKGE